MTDPMTPYLDPDAGPLDRSLGVVRFLRDHCDWDRKQTARSLVPHLLEEVNEVVEAIQDGPPETLRGELGDLLLNLAFQIVVAEEEGHFDAHGVYDELEAKMRRRHPHLFDPNGQRERQDEESWEQLKIREESKQSVLGGLPPGLDPLIRAHRIQEKVSQVGFDWSDPYGAMEKLREEVDEVQEAIDERAPDAVAEELGDVLFSVVNLARLSGHHAHDLLDRANRKFQKRFEALEEAARETGLILGEASLQELDVLWDQAKQREKQAKQRSESDERGG